MTEVREQVRSPMTWPRMPLCSRSDCSPWDDSSGLLFGVPCVHIQQENKNQCWCCFYSTKAGQDKSERQKACFIDKPRELFSNIAVKQWREIHNLSQQGSSTSTNLMNNDMTHLKQHTIWPCCSGIRNRWTGMTNKHANKSLAGLSSVNHKHQKSVVGEWGLPSYSCGCTCYLNEKRYAASQVSLTMNHSPTPEANGSKPLNAQL